MTPEDEVLAACCICLAVDVELYNIQEYELDENMLNILAAERRACGWCGARLRRGAELRARAARARTLLRAALARGHAINMQYLRTIDRVAEKLNLNLKIQNVHNSDSTQLEELIKLEDIKQESNDFIETVFVGESADNDFYDDIDDTPNDCFEYDDRNNFKCEDVVFKNAKRSRSISKVPRKRKAKKSEATNEDSNSTPIIVPNKGTRHSKTNDGDITKIVKPRIADKGFLSDFDVEEFERKFDVKIDVLSEEEQLREVEARKAAASFAPAAFGCDVCGKQFASKHVHETHMARHTPSAGAHTCRVCALRFRARGAARAHAAAHRLRFTCARCGFLTRSRFIAKNHFLSHVGSTHKCPHCDAVFNKHTSCLTHVRRQHAARLAACDQCGEGFVGATGLRHHKTRAHRKTAKPQQKCDCGAEFASSEALERHLSSSENGCDTSLRPCGTCGEGFPTEEALRSHAAAHAFPCPQCGLSFVCAVSRDTHVRRVHLRQPLQEPPRARPRRARLVCELCGRECTSLANLQAHQRRHSGARPHACCACPRRFASRHNLQRHHRVVHLGERPAARCGECGKLLAHAASLKLHERTVHRKMPAPPRRRRDNKRVPV